MTIAHDLTLTPGERIQRRMSNLEQGYIANQQTGAWIKTITQCSEFANGSATAFAINCLQFEIPAYGQYFLSYWLDAEVATANGLIETFIFVGASAVSVQIQGVAIVRTPMTGSWGGWIEKGTIVNVRGLFTGNPGGLIKSYQGAFVVHKIA